jgi:Protein of unknown function (DUF559)
VDAEQANALEELLVEMTYAWSDIERELDEDHRGPLLLCLSDAFRVEAVEDENDFRDPNTIYDLLFDAEDPKARTSARQVRQNSELVSRTIKKYVEVWDRRYDHRVRVVPRSASARGLICGRKDQPPPKKHIDVTEVPDEKPDSNVPLVQRDKYWLTPIEVPFYDALRDTGAIFAVQPWVQGVETRFRPDFMVFYDGGIVVVELDGHESHKSREQRTRDARRQRWFEGRGIKVLRWTGSEVHANAQECVRELLEIVRGKQGRF